MSEVTEAQYTVGRSGIKIPPVKFRNRTNVETEIGFFFHNLWNLNGVEISYISDGERTASLHELTVPAEGDLPLVIVRAQYSPTTIRERRRDIKGNIRHNMWDDSGGFGTVNEDVVTIGMEEHSILLSPDVGDLKWKQFLTYNMQYKGKMDSSESGSIGQIGKGRFYFDGYKDLVNEGHRKTKNVDEYWEYFSNGVEKHLRQFVELVSVPE